MSLLSKFALAAILLASYISNAQALKYAKGNFAAIRSISPSDTDYDDLEVIGKAIGDSRVVMLGEQDHGDAPTFLAKTRLIKYLHEKKGFNVLAFESDFFALTLGWEKIERKKDVMDSFIVHNIFPIWTRCDACADLFYSYVPSTQTSKHPLIIAGFDNQVHGRFSKNNLYNYMDSLLTNSAYFLKTPAFDKKSYLDTLSKLQSKFWETDLTLAATFFNFSVLSDKLLSTFSGDTVSEACQLVKSLEAHADQMYSYYKFDRTDRFAGSKIRDRAMAENLRWLALHKFPGEKIIIWAANGHIMKSSPKALKGKTPWWYESMGTVFGNEFGLDTMTYVLGFTSDTGTAGRLSKSDTVGYKIAAPQKGSFEKVFPDVVQYGFVDFKSYNHQTEKEEEYFFAKGFGHYNQEAKWNRVFDGFFYIKNMYRCVNTKPKD